ncbi:MAG: efflux RND transporter periplasmic adaptor subunit [Planctomycetaceae bacterium]|nr:efflux RND transporter periplasmic adaptor subunit [Planctomycetaceae bacterium]
MIRKISIPIIFYSLLSGCTEPEPLVRPPITVSVSPPVIRSVDSYVEISGRSDASEIFEARARVPGTLMPTEDGKPRFTEGENVSKGQELFSIEPEPYQAAVDAANARLESAEAQKTLADTTYQRSKNLYEKSAITRAELDEREAEFNVAQAAISQEKAALKQAEIELGYTTINAEFEGIIGESHVDEGNIVGVGEFTLLATVRKTDPLHIYFDAAERVVLNFLRKLSEGDAREIQEITLEIGYEGETGYPHQGQLQLIDNQIDPNTGTALLRGTMRNPDQNVLPGSYARIRIKTLPIPEAVLVSEIAINTDLSGKYILIVNEAGIVEQRRVRLGQLYDGFRHVTALWKPEEAEPKGESEIPTDFQYIHAGLLQARPGLTVKSEVVPMKYPTKEDEPELDETTVKETKKTKTEPESPDSGPPEDR